MALFSVIKKALNECILFLQSIPNWCKMVLKDGDKPQTQTRRKTMIKAYERETGNPYPLCSLLGEPDHDGYSTVAPKYREGNVVWMGGERCLVYVSDRGKEYLVPTSSNGLFCLLNGPI